MLQLTRSQRVRRDLATEQQQSEMVDVEVSLNMIVKWVNFEQEFGKRN